MQVVTRRGGRDLPYQFGCADNVAFLVKLDPSAPAGMNDEESVRLRHILEVEFERAVIAPLDAGRVHDITSQPEIHIEMLLAMLLMGDGRRHMDDSFDELRF